MWTPEEALEYFSIQCDSNEPSIATAAREAADAIQNYINAVRESEPWDDSKPWPVNR